MSFELYIHEYPKAIYKKPNFVETCSIQFQTLRERIEKKSRSMQIKLQEENCVPRATIYGCDTNFS